MTLLKVEFADGFMTRQLIITPETDQENRELHSYICSEEYGVQMHYEYDELHNKVKMLRFDV